MNNLGYIASSSADLFASKEGHTLGGLGNASGSRVLPGNVAESTAQKPSVPEGS